MNYNVRIVFSDGEEEVETVEEESPNRALAEAKRRVDGEIADTEVEGGIEIVGGETPDWAEEEEEA